MSELIAGLVVLQLLQFLMLVAIWFPLRISSCASWKWIGGKR
jgi:hypothetical protein